MSCHLQAVVNEGSWEAPRALLSAGCAAPAAAVETKTRHSLPYHPTVYRFMSLLFIPPAVLILFLSACWGKSVGESCV